jgi:hypothetical protein
MSYFRKVSKKTALFILASSIVTLIVFANFERLIGLCQTRTSIDHIKSKTDHAQSPETTARGKFDAKQKSGSSTKQSLPNVDILTFRPGEFETAWDIAAKSGSSEITRLNNLSIIIGRMNQFGESELILQKIQTQFGPGKSRCQLIGQLFLSCLPGEISKVYSKLEFPDEISAANFGISQNLAMSESPDSIDRKKFGFLGDQLDAVIEKSFEFYVSRFRSQPDQLSAAVESVLSTMPSSDQQLRFLSNIKSIAPFDCWKQLSDLKLELSLPDQNGLLSQMIRRDATRAMDQVAALTGGEKYFSNAFQMWLEHDARKPIEWLESNKQKLGPAQQESAMQGIAEYTARQGDSETA